MQRSEIIKLLVDRGTIDKQALYKLVRMRPPLEVTFLNLAKQDLIDIRKVERDLAAMIKEGILALTDLEGIEGLDTGRIARDLSELTGVPFMDIEDKEIDIQLFNRVPFAHLKKHLMIPIEETDINIVVGMANINDIQGEEVMQRAFPKKPIKKVIVRPEDLKKKLQQLEINESIHGWKRSVKT